MDDERLQEHILGKIELALGGRSWNWLAGQSGIPQSTLATQKATPRFTIEALRSIGRALHRPIGYFLPDGERGGGDPAATEAFRQIAGIVREAELLMRTTDDRAADLAEDVVPRLPEPQAEAPSSRDPESSRPRRRKSGGSS